MNDVLKEGMELMHLTARTPAALQAEMKAKGAKQVVSLAFTGKHTAYVLVEKKEAPAKPAAAKPEADPAPEADKDDKSTSRRRG